MSVFANNMKGQYQRLQAFIMKMKLAFTFALNILFQKPANFCTSLQLLDLPPPFLLCTVYSCRNTFGKNQSRISLHRTKIP